MLFACFLECEVRSADSARWEGDWGQGTLGVAFAVRVAELRVLPVEEYEGVKSWQGRSKSGESMIDRVTEGMDVMTGRD